MKKKNVCLLVGLAAASSMLFSGCGKEVTAESLIKEMNAKIENVKSCEMEMDMDMSMKINMLGIEMDMDMSMEGEIQTIVDPAISHMDMEMSVMGMTMDMDVYTQVEDNQVVTYTGIGGEWTKVVESASEELKQNNFAINMENLSGLTLDDKTTKLDGGEAYKLTGSISGAELQDVVESVETMMEGMGEIDLSKIQADITLWIYKDTGYPATIKIVMDASGLSSEVEGMTVTMNDIIFEMDYTEFNKIKSIEIPQEALMAEEVDVNDLLTQ